MNKVRISVYDKSGYFEKYLIYKKIKYNNLVCGESYLLDIDIDDLDYFKNFDYSIVKYFGIKNIIYFFKCNIYPIIGFVCGLIILYLLSNTIFNVVINCEEESVKEIISSSLNKYNISKYKKIKNFYEENSIKEKILNDNRDYLEWIEIYNIGSTYYIDTTLRISKAQSGEELKYSNIVSLYDSKIMNITASNGVIIKNKGDYVKKGDVIISGSVYKGESLIYNTYSKGEVYGEVWYTITSSIPYEYTTYEKTGRVVNHYYINIFGKNMTIMGKYDTDKAYIKKEKILDKPYLIFDLYKEVKTEYDYNVMNLSESEAYDLAIKKADEEMNNTLKDGEYIIGKKVLKKEALSSKIKLEIFYKVYKNIGIISKIEEEYDS